MNAAEIKAFLARHGLLARRDLGQNFLVDETLASRLVDLAGVEPGDRVIEIGTGLGVLTGALARSAQRVVTLEVDAGLVRALRADAVLPDNVELVHADALEVDLARYARAGAEPVRLVSNLPYHVSAPLLRRLLDLRGLLIDWSVMLQREVAARLLARPGSRDYGSLSVLHGLTVTLAKGMDLSSNCFFPVPRVESTFVRIAPLETPAVEANELADVERVVRAAFAKRRKTLVNSLRAGALGAEHSAEAIAAALSRCAIEPRARAESLEPAQLLALARELR
ncbi:MAG: ribosomal RNA small subunit methyltransferase A [Deltaproteobacteria bacterium]|nr:ribosomal RNA small subunit methyltransferase A [Deltaproteobacteria bacterium]